MISRPIWRTSRGEIKREERKREKWKKKKEKEGEKRRKRQKERYSGKNEIGRISN